ncbi:MAG: M36 family metallopeptidase [Bacteroidetes bacterium]|nr:M36 family metallopeptidase [Bacteroidota bacterium]
MRQTFFMPLLAGLFFLCPCLTSSQTTLDSAAIRQLVIKYADRLHISNDDAANAVISGSYLEPSTGIQYVYLQQSYQQIGVHNSILSLSFKNGTLLYSSGRFIDSIGSKAGSATPAVTPVLAVNKTAEHLRLKPAASPIVLQNRLATREHRMLLSSASIAKKDIEAKLIWVSPDEGATVRLAWNVNIDVLGSGDWWDVRVDAATGAVINKNNLTIHENRPAVSDAENDSRESLITAAPAAATVVATDGAAAGWRAPLAVTAPPNVSNASYLVVPFPYESPIHHAIAAENEPWLKASSYNTNAISYGWHFDGTNNYNITRGNNVFAYLDVTATNTSNASTNWPDTSSTGAPALSFSNTPDGTQQVTLTANKKFALDNLFYWNNLMHDVYYQYGFTEAAGNFQMNNLGRGGAGGDFVNAQAQDGAGISNADFATPVDGSSGRMRMFIFPKDPVFKVNSPAAVAGTYVAKEGVFSVNNQLTFKGPVTGQLIYYNDDAAGTAHIACTPPANAISGFIALIDRGACSGGFPTKAKNAQNAGAIAIIVVNNVSGAPVVMGGTDNTITIPAIMISQSDGAALKAQLANNINVTLSSPPANDGAVDAGVVCHEYGHGISNRLTGGPANSSCLNNAEQAGEGWSDYMAMMMTTNWATASLSDGAVAHPIGNYVTNQAVTGGGIRRYPYSTNMSIDPHTYSDMISSGEVHDIGEIWCSALWDMTWNIIQQTGSITPDIYNSTGGGGNTIALQLVITAMKLQPCSPGFIDSRNAILAADSILYGSIHKCAIWNAFARRGMGAGASQGSSNSTADQTVDFSLPSGVVLTKSPAPLIVAKGAKVTITHTATCNCQVPGNSYTISDTIPAGFNYVSSTGGTLNGNIVVSPAISFAAAQEAKTYSVTLQAGGTGCTVDSAINDNRDNRTIGSFTSANISGATGWTSSSLYAHTGTNSWKGPDAGSTNEATLTSASFTVGNMSVLSFWHYFLTEGTLDGGVVELSTNGGTTWIDASPYFIEYPYNATMLASGLSGRKAFSGGADAFRRTTINLGSFAGQTLRVRFRIASNGSQGSDGWFIDDIVVANGCGGVISAGMYNASAVRVDSAAQPVYVTLASSLPLTLLQFNARQAGREVLLAWQTSQEVNTASFEVQRSADGLHWSAISTVAANGQGSNDYQLYDNNPLTGTNYYRLRMIDKDLAFTYSPVRQVSIKDNGSFVIVPNPARDNAVIHFNGLLSSPEVLVYGSGGQMVQHFTISGNASYYTLSTAQMPAGVYTISVRSGNSTTMGKLVVVH